MPSADSCYHDKDKIVTTCPTPRLFSICSDLQSFCICGILRILNKEIEHTELKTTNKHGQSFYFVHGLIQLREETLSLTLH